MNEPVSNLLDDLLAARFDGQRERENPMYTLTGAELDNIIAQLTNLKKEVVTLRNGIAAIRQITREVRQP